MHRDTRIVRISTGLVIVVLLLEPALAQRIKEFTYAVRPRAVISITNECGPITVKASGNQRVVVHLVTNSDAVRSENEQHGNRIELQSHSATCTTDGAEYTVMVPSDS